MLTLPSSVGPAAVNVVVVVSVMDYDVRGNALHVSPSTATAVLTYPLIPAPVITPLAPIDAARNSQVAIIPVIFTSPATSPTYRWVQTGGTPVNVLSVTTFTSLSIETNGAAVTGETLTFSLTVNDGVNAAVTATFEVIVAARTPTGETDVLARMAFGTNIAYRNANGVWSQPVASTLTTAFTSAKRAPLVQEPTSELSGSYILISPQSVLVQRNGAAYHALTANPADLILDAEHSFLDQTILLTSGGQLLQLLPNATLTDTDNAAATIEISDITQAEFVRMTATPPYAGQRILVLSGPSGCLLIAVDDSFNIVGSLFLSASGQHLYGASDVMWVRMNGVESLHTGTLLIGTVDSNGHTYETEFDLANRRVLAVWDASQLRNQYVTTGELLFDAVDSYCGSPVAPTLSQPTYGSGGITLTWTQPRADLASGYTVLLSSGAGLHPLLEIGTGQITTVTTRLPAGATYSFAIVTHSLDGDSPVSNTVTIAI
jgi:hypothetical protein